MRVARVPLRASRSLPNSGARVRVLILGISKLVRLFDRSHLAARVFFTNKEQKHCDERH